MPIGFALGTTLRRMTSVIRRSAERANLYRYLGMMRGNPRLACRT